MNTLQDYLLKRAQELRVKHDEFELRLDFSDNLR